MALVDQFNIGETVSPSYRQNPNRPLSDFGGGEERQQRGQAALGLVGAASDYFATEQMHANDAKVMKGVADSTNETTALIDSFKQLKGENALKEADAYKNKFRAMIAETSGGMSNPVQNEMFAKHKLDLEGSFDRAVNLHTAEQVEGLKVSAATGAIQAASSAAVANYADPLAVAENKKIAIAAGHKLADIKGLPYDGDARKSLVQATTSHFNTGLVERALDDGKGKEAVAYFNQAIKDGELDEAAQIQLGRVVKNEILREKTDALYKEAKGMTLANGLPNIGRRDALVDKSDLDAVQKQQAKAEFRTREGMEIRNDAMLAANRAYVMQQSLQDLIKQGPLAPDVLARKADRLAEKIAKPGDAEELQLFKTMAQKSYAPSYSSNPETKVAIFEGIQNGTAKVADIQKALDENMLSQTDATAAFLKLNGEVTKKTSPELKGAWNEVKALANNKIAGTSRKEENAQFLVTMMNTPEYKNGDAVALVAKANEILKGIPGAHWYNTAVQKPTWKYQPGHLLGQTDSEDVIAAKAWLAKNRYDTSETNVAKAIANRKGNF